MAEWLVPGQVIRLGPQLRSRMMGFVGRAASIPGGEYDSIRRQMKQYERRRIPIAQPPPRPTKRKIVIAHGGPAGSVRVVFNTELAAVEQAIALPPPALGPSPGESRAGVSIAR